MEAALCQVGIRDHRCARYCELHPLASSSLIFYTGGRAGLTTTKVSTIQPASGQKLTENRWLNGSFFAAIHSIVHFGYLYRSSSVDWLRSGVLYADDRADIPSRGSSSSMLSCCIVSACHLCLDRDLSDQRLPISSFLGLPSQTSISPSSVPSLAD